MVYYKDQPPNQTEHDQLNKGVYVWFISNAFPANDQIN